MTPKETSFEKLEDVPDYLNEVSYFNYLSMHAGCKFHDVKNKLMHLRIRQ